MQAKDGGAIQNIRSWIPQPRVRLFELEYAQLLTEGKDLEAEVVTGTDEGAEAGKKTKGKWNHVFGSIA